MPLPVPSSSARAGRRALVALAAALLPGTPAAAQIAPAISAPVTSAPAAPATSAPAAAALDADPAEALGRYLRVLSTNPRHLESLTGAGRAALAVGDPSAAIGFFARAEELAPRNGRIKAGLAAALVQMEQPKLALKLFDDATDLGVPAAEVAADRGLAWDLRGEGRRAQADYVLALRTRDEPETRRRLALSQAIAGDGVNAMATLDPLLRQQDRAAWRTRAFVLALTGDALGARAAVLQAMPGVQGEAMAGFLPRLAALRAPQKAMAVHFGHLPADSRMTRGILSADARPTPAIPRRLRPAVPALGQGGEPAAAPLALAPIDVAAMAASPSVASRPPAPVPRAASPTLSASANPAATITAAAGTTQLAALAAPVEAKPPATTAPARAGMSGKVASVAKPKPVPKPVPKTPERYWVQVASGANKADLSKVWTKQKASAPKLLGGRQAYTAPWRASNRLLTGPFDTAQAAQGFVNALMKAGLGAIQFTTRAGSEVERLSSK